MIKFFRKIRQGLLTENKFSKYLLYAIGEIVLVVIGILIALSINNWNESLKTQSRVSLHYKELKEEPNFDLARINQHIIRLEAVDNYGIHIRTYLNMKLVEIDTLELKRAFLGAGFYVTFDASRVAYDNLVSSGDINLITNNALKRKLGEYHNPGGWNKSVDAGYNRQSIEEYHHYRHYFIEPLMDRSRVNNEVLVRDLPDEFDTLDKSIDDFKIDWEKVLEDKEYSVKLDRLHTVRLNQKWLYYGLRNSMKAMIIIIDQELDRK